MNANPFAPLHPELAGYETEIAQVTSQADDLLRGLSDAQYNWRPATTRWSIAQCMAHIVVTDEIYIPVLQKCIADARAKGTLGDGPYRHGWLGNWFLRTIDAPPKRRFKNPARITPPADQTLARGLADFHAVHESVTQLVRDANGVDLGRAKFRSPFLKLLQFSLGQGIAIMLAHGRRHLWQAGEVRKAAGFPARQA